MRFFSKYAYMLVCFSLMACFQGSKETLHEAVLFPDDAHTILQINKKNDFLKQIKENLFWNNCMPNVPNIQIEKLLQSLPEQQIFVAYTHNDVYCITSQTNDSTSIWKNASQQKVDSLVLENQKWYFVQQGKNMIISTSAFIEDFGKNIKIDQTKQVYQLKKTINKNALANLFLNKQKNENFFSTIFSSNSADYFAQWTLWDIVLSKDKIEFNGTTLNKEASKLTQISNTIPAELQSLYLVPAKVQGATFYSFSHPNDEVFDQDTADFYTYLNEVAILYFADNKNVMLATSSDMEETLQHIPILKTDVYQDKEIHTLEQTPEIRQLFSQFQQKIFPKYALLYNSSLFFSENTDILKEIVNDLQTNKLLHKDVFYEQLSNVAISKASYTEISNLNKKESFAQSFPHIADNYRYALLQITPHHPYFILNFTSIMSPKKEIPRGGLTQKFQINLDAEAFTSPQWVVNHQTKQKEIVIQDVENNLYLISNTGQILWKKKLDAGINSRIFQVDLFKNGNLQLALSTSKSVWIIDRNGRNVGAFPLTFDKDLLPLEVFDYEGDKEYRLAISTSDDIQLIDGKANYIKGFEKQHITSAVLHQPQHFRVNAKDYLIFTQTNGKIHILHRNGKERIAIKERFSLSDNDIYLLNDWFVLTTQDGKQIYIDTKGGIRVENRQYSKYHKVTYNHQVEAVITDNVLFINKKPIALPYGIYTKPKIFKIGKVVYVSVTDLQNNNVYLFNSKAEALPNFPVYGSSIMDVTIDNGKPLFAFLKDKYSVFVYEF